MNFEIIEYQISNEKINFVSARKLHEHLNIKSRFNDWINNRINKFEFIENEDFIWHTKSLVTHRENGQNGYAEYRDCLVTIDVAKELAMIENNPIGRAVRKYFINVEKQFKKQQTSQNHDFLKLTNELNDYEIYSNKLLGFIENLETRKQTTLFRFDKIMLQQFGTSPLKTFKIDLDSQFFLPTELGKMINKSAVEINLMLANKGFQVRENGIWKMTSSGRDFGIAIVGKYNQIKWKIKTIM